ncbi:hypothetical protein FRB96_004612 [Tulasnella sp. 330]|nr:hypothetical protein FRB96_004612 [Tulasnella sp. 330]KAG8866431.1 hypothetical protein FRB97_003975 [Tulasnella sp. 331]KAG8877891.1 hypothetical protein FRB98_006494 [Tulasnella sp. 332]
MELNAFEEALKTLQTDGFIKSKQAETSPQAIAHIRKHNCSAVVGSKHFIDRLVALRAFTVRTTLGTKTFFVTGRLSWGDGIVMDIVNGPQNGIDELIERVGTSFKQVICWKDVSYTEEQVLKDVGEPSYLRWAKVPQQRNFPVC